MKKVILFSAIALAAAVSCTKSEVVDTKFNEQIGFETYLGRDAMTKAAVATTDNVATLGLFGFYTGNVEWATTSAANLWDNAELTKAANWVPTEVKYWTNDTDKYTFLAYAPYATATNGITVTTGADPKVTYAVNADLKQQIDLLYANDEGHVNMVKPANGTNVALKFNHALSRLTVKAKAASEVFKFDVKEVSIAGNFNTTGTLNLATAAWTATPAAATYTFYTNTAAYAEATALTTEYVDYAGTDNYLMMIPTNFSAEGATAATLTVKYTTFYQNQESTVNTVTFPVETNFEKGKAYAINLEFMKDNQPITFSVTVADWDENTTVQTEYPVDEPATEEPTPDPAE